MPPKKTKRAKPKLGGRMSIMPVGSKYLKPIRKKAVKAGAKLKRKVNRKRKAKK